MNELVHIGPISPLRQRLLDDMAMRRFGPETQRNYLRDVSRFATWLQRSPHTATTEDIRQFQFEQLEAGVPAPTMNNIVAALRFFFRDYVMFVHRPSSSHQRVLPIHVRILTKTTKRHKLAFFRYWSLTLPAIDAVPRKTRSVLVRQCQRRNGAKAHFGSCLVVEQR